MTDLLVEYKQVVDEIERLQTEEDRLTRRCVEVFSRHIREDVMLTNVTIVAFEYGTYSNLIMEWLQQSQLELTPEALCTVACNSEHDYFANVAVVPQNIVLPQNDFEEQQLAAYLEHMGDRVWV